MKARLAVLIAFLGACRAVPDRVSGLRPLSPLFACDVRRPTLKWEAFPTEEVPPELRDRVRDVRYDLRIRQRRKGPFCYSRDDLPAPQHTLEEDLEVGPLYEWSVRARFTIDGSSRATQWTEAPPYSGRHPGGNPDWERGIPLSVRAQAP